MYKILFYSLERVKKLETFVHRSEKKMQLFLLSLCIMAVCERLKLNRTSEYFKVSEWPVVGKLDPVNLKIFSKRE